MKIKTSLLLCLLALAATVLLGAPLSAIAAVHPDVTVKDSLGGTVSDTTPYSPKVTCGGCHFNCSTGEYSADQTTWCDGTAGKLQVLCTSATCTDYASAQTQVITKHQGYGTPTGVAFTTHNVTVPMHGASTGKHSTEGRNEELAANQRTIWGAPAFISSPGMFGRY